jgi:DNA replication protein DnaC
MTFEYIHKRLANYQRPSHIPGKRSHAFAEYIASIPAQKRISLQQRMLDRHNNGECIGCTHQGVPLGVNGMELPLGYEAGGFFAPPEFCDCELGVRYSQRIERQREEYHRKSKLERYTYARRLFEAALLPSPPKEHTFANWPIDFERPASIDKDVYLSVLTERARVREATEVFMRAFEEPELVKKKGLCIQGWPGVGKTGLALSAADILLQAGYYTLSLSAPALLILMRHSEQEQQMLYTLRRTPILFLDNLGDPHSMDPAPYYVRRILTDIFEARYSASLPTLITTELDNEQLRCQLSDGVFSLMRGLCCFYELPGADLR